MRYSVLGPLVVHTADGSDVTPRGPQQRRLVAALVAAWPAPVTVDALGELLWPAGAPSANALQAQVSKLRRQGIAIAGRPGAYQLHDVTTDDVDATRLEQLLACGRQELDGGDPHRAERAFAEALALVRGRPLDDVADDDIGRVAAARLASLVDAARAGRLDALLAAGRLDDAAIEADALIATDPLDERWWAVAMEVSYRQGRQADALRRYQEARRVLAHELGLEPGPALRDLERRILAQDPGLLASAGHLPPALPRGAIRPTPARRARPLPARLTPVIGRDRVVAELRDDLAGHRLVTLVGPGGAGKTTTALEAARPGGGDDAVFVALAPVGEPDGVVEAVAAALGVSTVDGPAAPSTRAAESVLDRVVATLSEGPRLLVLDNCEHVVGAVAGLVHELLEACPDLTVLATSRESLGVPGELVRVLPPLDLADAVMLFVERARRTDPSFEPGDEERLVIADICARLDRLPLGIELAAARMRTMTPRELRARLVDRFAALGTGPRTAEARQQTLRGLVDWSHDLLDTAERAVFRRLAVFSGGATMAGAQAVCGDGALVMPYEVAGIVERLVDKSLVVADRAGQTTRFTMLQTLQDYATQRLAESGEQEQTSRRHARHVAALLAPAHDGLMGPEQRRWIEVIGLERENLRTALDTAIALGDADLALRLVTPVGWYFYMVGQTEAGEATLADALAVPGVADPWHRAAALAQYGWLAANGPQLEPADWATQQALDVAASIDDASMQAFVIATRVMALFFQGRAGEIADLHAQIGEAAERSGNEWAMGLADLVDGEVAHFTGEADRAEAAFLRAVERFGRVGDEFATALTLSEAAEVAEMRGEYDLAIDLVRRSIELSRAGGFSSHPMGMRTRLANLYVLRGDLDEAEQLLADVIADDAAQATPWLRAMTCYSRSYLARRRDRPDEALHLLEQAWSLQRSREVPVVASMLTAAIGYAHDQLGDADAAWLRQLESLRHAVGQPSPRALANSLEGLAGALAARGTAHDATRAARLLGTADALRVRSGGALPPGERFDVDRAERRVRAVLGDAATEDALAAGALEPLDDVVSTFLGA